MLKVTLDGFNSRLVSEWRCAGKHTWRVNARKHAEQHGAAGAFLANDGYVLFYMDNGKLRQKTWKRATIY